MPDLSDLTLQGSFDPKVQTLQGEYLTQNPTFENVFGRAIKTVISYVRMKKGLAIARQAFLSEGGGESRRLLDANT